MWFLWVGLRCLRALKFVGFEGVDRFGQIRVFVEECLSAQEVGENGKFVRRDWNLD